MNRREGPQWDLKVPGEGAFEERIESIIILDGHVVALNTVLECLDARATPVRGRRLLEAEGSERGGITRENGRTVLSCGIIFLSLIGFR